VLVQHDTVQDSIIFIVFVDFVKNLLFPDVVFVVFLLFHLIREHIIEFITENSNYVHVQLLYF